MNSNSCIVPKCIIAFLIALPIYSQIKLEGSVLDSKTNESIPYATVLLKNSNDDFLIGTTTDELGNYTLEYANGTYILQIDFLGYKTHKVTVELNNDLTKNIQLSSEDINLEEVVVTAERTTVNQLIDKKIINVGEDILSSGGDAATVLSQLSEVNADENGGISLRGNSNVQVLVNGKPSPLGNSDLLTQIPASEIKTVEIITSPSAKYTADGLTGIINILTKKKIKKGITLSNSASVNSLKAFSGSSTLAYGKNKINYTLGAYYRKNRNEYERYVERFGTFPYSENSDRSYQGDVYRVTAGMDWFPNKNNEFSWGITYSDNEHFTDIEKTIINDVSVFQRGYSGHIHRTLRLNGNYRHSFKKETDFIELDIQFSNNKNTLKGLFEPNLTALDNITENKIATTNIALDYVNQINEKLKFETGYLWYHKELDNDRELLDDLNLVISEDSYEAQQYTHAIYMQLYIDLGKVGIQTGLRGELYNQKALFITDNTDLNTTFTNLFPSIHFKYELNDDQTFGIGYNRRTSRPRLGQMNPISQQSDEFSFREGNPFLTPEFSNNVDVSYQFKKGKFSISPTISYRIIKDVILESQTISNEGVQVTTYLNNGNSNSYGVELAVSYKPFKWWRSNYNFNWNYEDLNSSQILYFRDFERSSQFTFKNDFTFNKKFSGNISWRYNAPNSSFYEKTYKNERVDIGLKHKIFKKNGTLSLRFTDIFNTFVYSGFEEGIGYKRVNRSKPTSRAVHFTFSYNLRKGEIGKRKKKERDY
jgi:outer membrane receptor protein involved in Fe transport